MVSLTCGKKFEFIIKGHRNLAKCECVHDNSK